MSETPAPSREAALARARKFRASEVLHQDLMKNASLPHIREKHRVAAERYAALATADERLAASPPRVFS